jgi:SAM-dependent methyltransferase
MLGFRWPARHDRPADEPDLREAFDQYVTSAQERQNAIDLIPHWNCALPPEADVLAGTGGLYADTRVIWAIERLGGVAGQRVLEIGPMEANHTYMLEKAGARVHAVEANRNAFLKCLIAKEILGLGARFSLAEINAWLDASTESFDFILACGVLYHMRDPLGFLDRLARKSSALFLWTHVASAEPLEPFEIQHWRGLAVRLLPRAYLSAQKDPAFCGGVFDNPRWIARDDLFAVLAALGFDAIETAHEEPDHPNGPALSILARKKRA